MADFSSIVAKEQITEQVDPLALDIEDKELCRIIDERVAISKNKFESEYHLSARRERNEEFVFGRNQDKIYNPQRKSYAVYYSDNVLYEIESAIKATVFAKLPDMIVVPGNETQSSKDTSDALSDVVNDEIRLRKNRKVMEVAFRHHPVYFTGVIKAKWNPEIDDFEFVPVYPNNVVVDFYTPSNDADRMKFICEYLPITVEEVLMRFPEKKEEFISELQKTGLSVGDKPTWKQKATTIKISEVWFTWYKRKSDTEWEREEGVLWKYGKCILKKMKNPNFDWEGETKYFSYDPETQTKNEVSDEEMKSYAMTGMLPPNVQGEKIFYNYFKFPRKPYYFVGFDQWHKTPLDETSRIEQNIYNQQNLNLRGKQIGETLNNKGKHIFSKESGLSAKDIQNMDMNDPEADLLVDGDVNKTHSFMSAERPSAQEFQDLQNSRSRMYGVAGAAAIRGDLQTDVATSNQIAREADFTRADDLAEATVNSMVEWMAEWSLQFIKLRYTKEHLRKILGQKGDVTYIKLNRDMVEDGMEVKIKASGTDKIKAQKNAMEMAKSSLIDPLTFFEDIGVSNPKIRLNRLMEYQQNPAAYMLKYAENVENSAQMAEMLNGGGVDVNGAMPEAGTQIPPTSPTVNQAPQPENLSVEPSENIQGSPNNLI